MIYYVEGCTCSGKTTFCKEFLEGKSNVLKMAKKHTPPIIPNETPLERQERVFQCFMDNFKEMLQTDEHYLADYSPAGVIPFTFALASTTNDIELKEKLQFKAISMLNDWRLFVMQYADKLFMLKYFTANATDIITRLQNRKRQGDTMWSEDFIVTLVEEYNHFF